MPEKMLPKAVTAFVDAMNRCDLEGLLATFAPDAAVNDQHCEFRGPGEIRGWLAKQIVGDHVTMKVLEATLRGESATVSAAMDGTYDKTGLPMPFVLSFYFSLDRDRIVQLAIIHNRRPAPSTTPPAEAHKQVVRRFFELFAAGQVKDVIALFHEDATYWFPTTRKTLTMPELADGLTWIQSRLDGPMTFELGPIVAEGKAVAVQLESFAKTREGKRFNNLYHVYFEFEGDRVRRAREYNDTAHVWATLRAGERRAEE